MEVATMSDPNAEYRKLLREIREMNVRLPAERRVVVLRKVKRILLDEVETK